MIIDGQIPARHHCRCLPILELQAADKKGLISKFMIKSLTLGAKMQAFYRIFDGSLLLEIKWLRPGRNYFVKDLEAFLVLCSQL